MLRHMRTTIRFDETLLRAAKKRAADTGRTLTAVIEDALRRVLAEWPPVKAETRPIPTYGAGGTLPGVDLDDSAALLDVMDDR
jgi:hypothetical protein